MESQKQKLEEELKKLEIQRKDILIRVGDVSIYGLCLTFTVVALLILFTGVACTGGYSDYREFGIGCFLCGIPLLAASLLCWYKGITKRIEQKNNLKLNEKRSFEIENELKVLESDKDDYIND